MVAQAGGVTSGVGVGQGVLVAVGVGVHGWLSPKHGVAVGVGVPGQAVGVSGNGDGSGVGVRQTVGVGLGVLVQGAPGQGVEVAAGGAVCVVNSVGVADGVPSTGVLVFVGLGWVLPQVTVASAVSVGIVKPPGCRNSVPNMASSASVHRCRLCVPSSTHWSVRTVRGWLSGMSVPEPVQPEPESRRSSPLASCSTIGGAQSVAPCVVGQSALGVAVSQSSWLMKSSAASRYEISYW